MDWTQLNWTELDRLRDGFLSGDAASGPYWNTREALEAYDLTYAERIGWKWDHVLRELKLRGWTPPCRTVFDFGCGSGVASRRVIEAFGPGAFDSLRVWDHAAQACDFATQKAAEAFPGLDVSQATVGFLRSDEPIGLLVLSHVVNELDEVARANLLELTRRAEAILWCEPGTKDTSRLLGSFHETLRKSFRVVAPCTHAGTCPVLQPGKERDWCHFFAPPPPAIYADPTWVRFGQRAGIDLRSLPYAFLAFDRRPAGEVDPKWGRVIGRTEAFKPYTRFLNCSASGLEELAVHKRDDPRLIKELEKTKDPLVYRWSREGNKVVGGESAAFLRSQAAAPSGS